jgi:poly-gamma-glutamate capsule biosynthesis protein CapA/YwtB (metallophosphatase superfamily)
LVAPEILLLFAACKPLVMRFLSIVALSLFSFSISAQNPDSASVKTDSLVIKHDTLSIIGVGDIMMGTSYPEDKLPPNDGAFLMRNVEPVLRDADVTFGNLEGTLLDEGGTPKSCKDPSVCYVFRTPTRYVRNLISAGFDMMSLANNHAGDFGEAGRRSSMKTLEVANILHAGQVNQPTVIFVKDGIRYGLAAFAPNSNCVNLNDLEGAKRIVARLDSMVDIVIVSFHGGAEGAPFQNVPRTQELFHGENRGDVYKFAHTLIDAGADIIFGHGPHVTRAVDVYQGRFIIYSMGNFCTYRGISVSGVSGIAPIIKVFTDKKGKLYQAQIIPTVQTYGIGVKIDPDKQVIKKIQELTKKDFPESKIQIDDNGLITYLAY